MKCFEVNDTMVKEGITFKGRSLDFGLGNENFAKIIVPKWSENQIMQPVYSECDRQGTWEIMPQGKEPHNVSPEPCVKCGVILPAWEFDYDEEQWKRRHPEKGDVKENLSCVKKCDFAWRLFPVEYNQTDMKLDMSTGPRPVVELIPAKSKFPAIVVVWKIPGTKIRYNAEEAINLTFAQQYIRKNSAGVAMFICLIEGQSIYVIRADKRTHQQGYKLKLTWTGNELKVQSGDKSLFGEKKMVFLTNQDQVKLYLNEMSKHIKN
jgi:hypothetical protein